MQDTDLFQLALGLSSPWTVTRSEFDAVDRRLDLYFDFPRGSRFACAQCGRGGCAVHDTKEETWRHLDFFQHRTLLHARTPRVTCPECGVRKVATPWARAGSGFTLLFEAYVLALAKTMPIANAAERLGEHDTRLWRIVEHYVWRAVEKLDLSRVRRIAAAETSARRGHDYISLFVDMARRKVVYVADGKDAATVKEFADFLEAHGGRREAVTDASIDIRGGDQRELPECRDHVRQISRHQTRQRGRRPGAARGGAEQLPDQGPALHLPEERRSSDAGGKGGAVSVGSAEPGHDPSDADPHEPATAVHDERQIGSPFPDRWNAWVRVCDLAPMKKLAKTITAKSEGILRSIATGLSNGPLEAINGNVQAAKRKAKGYRTKRNLKAIVYLIAGDVLANSPI